MLKFMVKTLGIAIGLLLSGAAFAVGMGNINVTSALGEPLQAEIELVSVGKADKGNLSARLAAPDVFKGAGIDYPSSLPKLKFDVLTRSNGSYYIKLSTAQPVTDPFVNMLVELSWSSGRLLREYTFLLDPPGFQPETVKIPEIQPILSKPEEPAEITTEPVPEEMMQPDAAASSMLLSHEDMGMSAKSSNAKQSMAKNVATGEIKVKHGDTLSKIALDNKSADVSLERMLVALYRANSDAFDGKNMNRLKTGKILRLPEAADLDEIEQKAAVKEVRAQAVDWNAYRQKLAAASTAAPEQAPKQEVSGKISTSVADKTPPAKEGAKDIVKLSKGEAPGDKTAADSKNAQAKKQAQEEEATAKAKALKESNDRIALLEKTNKDMQHLLELKKQAAAADQAAKAEAPKMDGKTAAVPVEPAAASGVAATPKAKPKMAPTIVPPPPSMLDEVMSNPLYLAGGAAVLLGLGGFGYMRARAGKGSKPPKAPKKQKEEPVIETSMDDTASRISAPVAPSPDSGDFTIGSATASMAAVAESDVDAISEADLFLNFGRDAQAEEILVDAMEKNPANMQVKLKLLSIYANRKDTKSFSGIARQVQDAGDAAAWAQAAEMGRKMEPNNPMYGAAEESAVPMADETVVEPPKAEEPTGLDFDLGFTAAESAAADDSVLDVTQNSEASIAPSTMDFDLGESEPAAAPADEMASTMVLPVSEKSPSMDMDSMDFDITGSTPVADTAADTSLDDLVLDMPAADEKPADKELDADAGMAFTLDIPSTPEAETEPVAETEMPGLGEISLDLEMPATTPPVADEQKDALWHDVATKLDLARAYQEMGDAAGAREILEEVLRDGDERQRAAAEAMMQQMSV